MNPLAGLGGNFVEALKDGQNFLQIHLAKMANLVTLRRMTKKCYIAWEFSGKCVLCTHPIKRQKKLVKGLASNLTIRYTFPSNL